MAVFVPGLQNFDRPGTLRSYAGAQDGKWRAASKVEGIKSDLAHQNLMGGCGGREGVGRRGGGRRAVGRLGSFRRGFCII